MKQVLQDLKSGAVVVVEAPEPAPAPGRLLVRVEASLLSAGTESAAIAKARQSLLSKIREKPELLRQGWEELRQNGIAGVRERLANKFEGYAQLGYSCAGTVVHDGAERVAPGTLVACAGAGLANHAEFVSVPRLLTAVVPKGVLVEIAAYTTLGSIAMQGVRQARLQLGEYVAVIGLGLVGLLVAQLVRAAGCRVVGIDPFLRARERGQTVGCEVVTDPDQAGDAILRLSGGIGADAVIICAATSENSPVELAGKIARSRGRVVMVGATGMTIPREDYYLKELSFTLSRSYGPGRYDRSYEEDGHDYPLDYVRFTEQRNMQSFLELTKTGQVDTKCLTTHRFPVDEAPAAYALLNDREVDRAGILLTYAHAAPAPAKFAIQLQSGKPLGEGSIGVGFVGAGAYAQSVLLPLLKQRPNVALRCVMTRNGSHALNAARRFGFDAVCTRVEEVLNNPAVQLVFITTRHDSHAALACQALRAGKHLWVEKPLALSLEELRQTCQAMRENPACRVIVGFNRPFSRSARWLLAKLGSSGPRTMLYRINAGLVPNDSWVQDPRLGGGRLLGEGCHFFDFLRHAAGAEADLVNTETPSAGQANLQGTDNFVAAVRFANDSVGQILYSSQGSPAMGKEYFECFGGQRCGRIADFREADFFHQHRHERCPKHRPDKGQAALLDKFLDGLLNGTPPPMTAADIVESSVLTLAAQQSLVSRQPVAVGELRKQLA